MNPYDLLCGIGYFYSPENYDGPNHNRGQSL